MVREALLILQRTENPLRAHVRGLVPSTALAEPLKFSAGSFSRAGVWGFVKESTSQEKDLQWKYPDSEQGAPHPAEDRGANERSLEAHVRNWEELMALWRFSAGACLSFLKQEITFFVSFPPFSFCFLLPRPMAFESDDCKQKCCQAHMIDSTG
jgi:hypothetical protein